MSKQTLAEESPAVWRPKLGGCARRLYWAQHRIPLTALGCETAPNSGPGLLIDRCDPRAMLDRARLPDAR